MFCQSKLRKKNQPTKYKQAWNSVNRLKATKPKKIGLVNFKANAPKSFNRVKNPATEFHGKTPVTLEESMLDLGMCMHQ